jgi:methionine-rich copper-binding protein CopC
LGELVSKHTKIALGVICAIIALFCAIYVGKIVAHAIIVHEASAAKKEAIQKVKSIDEDKAAETVAKTIHGIKTFKEKVKDKLNKLDSTDNAKGPANGLQSN